MRAQRHINMTQGKPTGLLLRFAVPMLIGNIFQQTYSLADSVIVGQALGASALATYAGQNYGAGDMKRVKEGFRHGMLIAAVFTVVIMTVYQLLGEPIISLFVREAAVISLGAQALKLTSWFYIFLALIYMSRGILNGIGDALFAFINGVVEVICRVGLPMLLVLIPGLGLWSIWWTAGVTWLISGLSCMMRYLAWRRKAGAGC